MRCVKRGGAATTPQCLVVHMLPFEAPLTFEIMPTVVIVIIKELEAEKRGNTEAVTGVVAIVIVITSSAMPMPA
jgi:hypothetical protein